MVDEASIWPAVVWAVPLATAPTPHVTAERQAATLVSEMMEGEEPDDLYLQELQKVAGGSDNLLECLRWMVEDVDPRLGIPRYRFEAGKAGRGGIVEER